MGFQFAETMAGTVEWTAQPGVTFPFVFEVTAEAASTRAHLKDGKAVLRGVVRAPPVAQAADADGMITIRPIGQRVIRYELQFTGDDGEPYEMIGQKDISWREPLRTWTELPAEIFDGNHRRVGICRTAFDRKDFWSFLRSFKSIK